MWNTAARAAGTRASGIRRTRETSRMRHRSTRPFHKNHPSRLKRRALRVERPSCYAAAPCKTCATQARTGELFKFCHILSVSLIFKSFY